MQIDPDVTRTVRSWLRTDEHEVADRVLDNVLGLLDATPQRRSRWPAWRFAPMNNAFKLAAAAAAVVLAVVVGINLLPGSGQPSSASGAASPSAPGAASPSALGAATASAPGSASPSAPGTPAPCAPGAATPNADSRAVPTGPMSAGLYHLDINLCRYVTTNQGTGVRVQGGLARVTFEVPAGWSGNGSGILKGGGNPPGGLAMAPWTINRVYIEPCRTTGAESRGDLADPPLMRTLDGIGIALSDWWGGAGDSPLATKPTNATLAGMPGRYVEVRAPKHLDFATCDGGEYTLWVDESGGRRSVQGPGELDRAWMVDVIGSDSQTPGGLVVIDAASLPGTSAKDLAELQSIVDSMKIELTGGS
jgi:hypothetical protein